MLDVSDQFRSECNLEDSRETFDHLNYLAPSQLIKTNDEIRKEFLDKSVDDKSEHVYDTIREHDKRELAAHSKMYSEGILIDGKKMDRSNPMSTTNWTTFNESCETIDENLWMNLTNNSNVSKLQNHNLTNSFESIDTKYLKSEFLDDEIDGDRSSVSSLRSLPSKQVDINKIKFMLTDSKEICCSKRRITGPRSMRLVKKQKEIFHPFADTTVIDEADSNFVKNENKSSNEFHSVKNDSSSDHSSSFLSSATTATSNLYSGRPSFNDLVEKISRNGNSLERSNNGKEPLAQPPTTLSDDHHLLQLSNSSHHLYSPNICPVTKISSENGNLKEISMSNEKNEYNSRKDLKDIFHRFQNQLDHPRKTVGEPKLSKSVNNQSTNVEQLALHTATYLPIDFTYQQNYDGIQSFNVDSFSTDLLTGSRTSTKISSSTNNKSSSSFDNVITNSSSLVYCENVDDIGKKLMDDIINDNKLQNKNNNNSNMEDEHTKNNSRDGERNQQNDIGMIENDGKKICNKEKNDEEESEELNETLQDSKEVKNGEKSDEQLLDMTQRISDNLKKIRDMFSSQVLDVDDGRSPEKLMNENIQLIDQFNEIAKEINESMTDSTTETICTSINEVDDIDDGWLNDETNKLSTRLKELKKIQQSFATEEKVSDDFEDIDMSIGKKPSKINEDGDESIISDESLPTISTDQMSNILSTLMKATDVIMKLSEKPESIDYQNELKFLMKQIKNNKDIEKISTNLSNPKLFHVQQIDSSNLKNSINNNNNNNGNVDSNNYNSENDDNLSTKSLSTITEETNGMKLVKEDYCEESFISIKSDSTSFYSIDRTEMLMNKPKIHLSDERKLFMKHLVQEQKSSNRKTKKKKMNLDKVTEFELSSVSSSSSSSSIFDDIPRNRPSKFQKKINRISNKENLQIHSNSNQKRKVSPHTKSELTEKKNVCDRCKNEMNRTMNSDETIPFLDETIPFLEETIQFNTPKLNANNLYRPNRCHHENYNHHHYHHCPLPQDIDLNRNHRLLTKKIEMNENHRPLKKEIDLNENHRPLKKEIRINEKHRPYFIKKSIISQTSLRDAKIGTDNQSMNEINIHQNISTQTSILEDHYFPQYISEGTTYSPPKLKKKKSESYFILFDENEKKDDEKKTDTFTKRKFHEEKENEHIIPPIIQLPISPSLSKNVTKIDNMPIRDLCECFHPKFIEKSKKRIQLLKARVNYRQELNRQEKLRNRQNYSRSDEKKKNYQKKFIKNKSERINNFSDLIRAVPPQRRVTSSTMKNSNNHSRKCLSANRSQLYRSTMVTKTDMNNENIIKEIPLSNRSDEISEKSLNNIIPNTKKRYRNLPEVRKKEKEKRMLEDRRKFRENAKNFNNKIKDRVLRNQSVDFGLKEICR
ncbi:hypothetical protein SNEBB_009235 [Seison nebaliae]|nr:hypothetical protein SNEBB_009235 [Seison nebaliae]